jgi:hypothetical protein
MAVVARRLEGGIRPGASWAYRLSARTLDAFHSSLTLTKPDTCLAQVVKPATGTFPKAFAEG